MVASAEKTAGEKGTATDAGCGNLCEKHGGGGMAAVGAGQASTPERWAVVRSDVKTATDLLEHASPCRSLHSGAQSPRGNNGALSNITTDFAKDWLV